MGRNEHFAEGSEQHYRNTQAVPSSKVPGVVHVPHSELPHKVIAHHVILGVENDKHGDSWQHTPREVIPPSTPIKTGQPYVGQEHVQRYASRRRPGAKTPIDFRDKDASDEDQNDGSPRLLRVGGELWHVDGLHRIAAARQLDRSFRARIFDADRTTQHQAGVAPATRGGVVDHLVHDHVRDNTMVDSDYHSPEHGKHLVAGEDHSWTDSDLHEYHQGLHTGGVADHRHG